MSSAEKILSRELSVKGQASFESPSVSKPNLENSD